MLVLGFLHFSKRKVKGHTLQEGEIIKIDVEFCGDRPLRSADAIGMYFALFPFMLRIIADFPSDHDKGLFQIKKYAKAG